MGLIKDLSGQTFGRLTALKFVRLNAFKKAEWLCQCSCGNQKIMVGANLSSGNSFSCGCYELENKTKHGMWKTPEYRAWQDMKDRCFNKNNPFYPDYGGRGITVCAEWINSFESFFASLGKRPGKRFSLDRIHVNGNYEPVNCRWADDFTQQRNRRDNRLIATEWGSIPVTQAAENAGLTKNVIMGRLRLGWPENMLCLPRGTRFIK